VRSPKRTLGATILTLEAFAVFFASLVARNLPATSSARSAGLSGGRALAVCGVVALACLVVAGMLRSPVGFALGWVVQAAVLATGLLVETMYVVGWLFAVLWFVALRVGSRIERDHALIAARRAADPD
jgi:Protein of unknown function (DUF4233)